MKLIKNCMLLFLVFVMLSCDKEILPCDNQIDLGEFPLSLKGQTVFNSPDLFNVYLFDSIQSDSIRIQFNDAKVAWNSKASDCELLGHSNQFFAEVEARLISIEIETYPGDSSIPFLLRIGPFFDDYADDFQNIPELLKIYPGIDGFNVPNIYYPNQSNRSVSIPLSENSEFANECYTFHSSIVLNNKRYDDIYETKELLGFVPKLYISLEKGIIGIENLKVSGRSRIVWTIK